MDLAQQMEGVLCRKDKGVIDEVMTDQSDLAKVVHTLKQIACIKG